jgi:hypothetical protein
VPLGTLGINPTVTPETYFVTTDWRGNYDDTQPYANRGPTASKVFAQERSVAPHDVMRGWSDVPMLRIDLENREEAPVEITHVYAQVIGTATQDDLDSVRLWTGDRVYNHLDPERFEEMSSGNVWYEGKVRIELRDTVVVRPFDTLSMYITVDISPTATTLTWFDLMVLVERGIISSSEVVATEIHDVYNLVRIWNTTGGRYTDTVGINEIYARPDSSGSGNDETLEWVELINPTSSDVDLNGWSIRKFVGFGTIPLYEFTSSTVITKNYGFVQVYLGDDSSGDNWINASDRILLFDNASTPQPVAGTTIGSVSIGESWAAYRKVGSSEPTGGNAYASVWYVEDTPTPKANNEEIPEFQDIVYPLMGTLAVYAVIRRRSTFRSRPEGATPSHA